MFCQNIPTTREEFRFIESVWYFELFVNIFILRTEQKTEV